MRIGIYTIHDNNYGAILQAYATQLALKNMGFTSEIVNYYPSKCEHYSHTFLLKSLLIKFFIKISVKAKTKIERFKLFHETMNLSKRYFNLDEIYQSPPQYDIHLVGSDQVWSLGKSVSDRNYFFLDFLNDTSRKISYASSFGTSNISPEYRLKLKELLSQFSYISVREDDGVAIIKENTGLYSKRVLDPTFLICPSDWAKMAGAVPLVNYNYILVYGFEKSIEISNMLQILRKKLKLPIISVSVSIRFPYKTKRFYQEAGPKEFLNLVKNATFVFTGSFHGLLFGIHFRKNFFILRHNSRNSRIDTILRLCNLQNRLITSSEDIIKFNKNQINIDYSSCEPIILKEVEESREWLRTAIIK